MTGLSSSEVVSFVFTEAARFQEQFARGDFRTGLERPLDGLHSIPDPKGDGYGALCIGPNAERRLREFVESQVANGRYAGKLEVEPLVRQFKEEIVDRFIRRCVELSDDEASAAFASSLVCSVSRTKELTHLIPCQLVNTSDPSAFEIGPVKFSHYDWRWPEIERQLQNWPTNPNYNDNTRQRLRQDIRTYYAEFNWLAEVTLAGWEPTPSRKAALEITTAAVEGLRLLLGGRQSNRLLVAGAAGHSHVRSHIVLASGKIEQTEVAHHSSIYPLDEGDWKWIESDEGTFLRRILGVAISSRFLVAEPTPLAIRFTDALHWYGLATEDTSAAAKLVLYLMAVERLLLPTKTGAIRSTVKNRSAYFCDWEKHNEKIERLYGARNDLSHGKRSPLSPDLADTAELARWFARQVLIGTLWQSESALKVEDFSSETLAAVLDDFHERHKRLGKRGQKANKVERPHDDR
ncbi:MAG: HEPN domain-containing protein [Hyphomicrobium sp.]|uniref:hypothetical protein n=1 Tax=Hyphomicrobium sp. TaxID=82 RepID=UPI0039E2A90F